MAASSGNQTNCKSWRHPERLATLGSNQSTSATSSTRASRRKATARAHSTVHRRRQPRPAAAHMPAGRQPQRQNAEEPEAMLANDVGANVLNAGMASTTSTAHHAAWGL